MTSTRIKFLATVFCAATLAMTGHSQISNSTAQKTRDAVKDTTNKTKQAVKDTAQKAVDAGKEGVHKAGKFATNVADKASSVATNMAAKAKEDARKVENAVTNAVDEIKRKVK